MKKTKVALAVLAVVSMSALGISSQSANAALKSVKNVAFFGFWKSNSFTQAVLAGVKEEAAKAKVNVLDLTPDAYDANAQIKAVQDETVKGDAQIYVILADDSVSMATAAKDAIAKGIKVVASFTPLGPDFTTLVPQVPGLIVVGESPVSNGVILGQLAAQACATKSPCNIAYLEGLKALPLDNARTKAFLSTVAAKAPKAKVVADVEGGYAPDSGKKAAQDVVQAHPEVNVMVGSSQAILGAQSVVDTSKVALIGNGSSKEAYAAVKAGKWFALYQSDVKGMGAKSFLQGYYAARGLKINPSFNSQKLMNPFGTAANLGSNTGEYSDLG